MAVVIAVFKIMLALDVFGSQYFSLVVNWSSNCLASKMIWRSRVRVGSFLHSETKAQIYFSSLKIFSMKRRAVEKEAELKRVEDMFMVLVAEKLLGFFRVFRQLSKASL